MHQAVKAHQQLMNELQKKKRNVPLITYHYKNNSYSLSMSLQKEIMPKLHHTQ